MIDIYTDGSSKTNPGIGGWGFVILIKGESFSSGGHEPEITTNNKMELLAVIKALQTLPKTNERITLYSDSKYVVDGVLRLSDWKDKNWRKIKNVEFWEEIIVLINELNITFKWVKAHNGNRWNEYVDRIATRGSSGIPTPLTLGTY